MICQIICNGYHLAILSKLTIMSSWFDQLDLGSLLKDSGLNELVEEVSAIAAACCICSYLILVFDVGFEFYRYRQSSGHPAPRYAGDIGRGK